MIVSPMRMTLINQSSSNRRSLLSLVNILETRACNLRLQWTSNWYQDALRRYRVQLITTPRNDAHLGDYCGLWHRATDSVGVNPQCFWENGVFYADISYVQGSNGHE
jgi:hypothetical protein